MVKDVEVWGGGGEGEREDVDHQPWPKEERMGEPLTEDCNALGGVSNQDEAAWERRHVEEVQLPAGGRAHNIEGKRGEERQEGEEAVAAATRINEDVFGRVGEASDGGGEEGKKGSSGPEAGQGVIMNKGRGEWMTSSALTKDLQPLFGSPLSLRMSLCGQAKKQRPRFWGWPREQGERSGGGGSLVKGGDDVPSDGGVVNSGGEVGGAERGARAGTEPEKDSREGRKSQEGRGLKCVVEVQSRGRKKSVLQAKEGGISCAFRGGWGEDGDEGGGVGSHLPGEAALREGRGNGGKGVRGEGASEGVEPGRSEATGWDVPRCYGSDEERGAEGREAEEEGGVLAAGKGGDSGGGTGNGLWAKVEGDLLEGWAEGKWGGGGGGQLVRAPGMMLLRGLMRLLVRAPGGGGEVSRCTLLITTREEWEERAHRGRVTEGENRQVENHRKEEPTPREGERGEEGEEEKKKGNIEGNEGAKGKGEKSQGGERGEERGGDGGKGGNRGEGGERVRGEEGGERGKEKRKGGTKGEELKGGRRRGWEEELKGSGERRGKGRSNGGKGERKGRGEEGRKKEGERTREGRVEEGTRESEKEEGGAVEGRRETEEGEEGTRGRGEPRVRGRLRKGVMEKGEADVNAKGGVGEEALRGREEAGCTERPKEPKKGQEGKGRERGEKVDKSQGPKEGAGGRGGERLEVGATVCGGKWTVEEGKESHEVVGTEGGDMKKEGPRVRTCKGEMREGTRGDALNIRKRRKRKKEGEKSSHVSKGNPDEPREGGNPGSMQHAIKDKNNEQLHAVAPVMHNGAEQNDKPRFRTMLDDPLLHDTFGSHLAIYAEGRETFAGLDILFKLAQTSFAVAILWADWGCELQYCIFVTLLVLVVHMRCMPYRSKLVNNFQQICLVLQILTLLMLLSEDFNDKLDNANSQRSWLIGLAFVIVNLFVFTAAFYIISLDIFDQYKDIISMVPKRFYTIGKTARLEPQMEPSPGGSILEPQAVDSLST
ncbi:hypothetical protein CYMTET_53518 [Cymbomonas tetramitiformis]|uniref:Uncharacterized protein n=1 Tax=Cymbomonas tetramitiformis TaxID=36881 RepID=A0AAE0BGP2_9CHLO|nr:hypothetical protein CYMTET_53518 [Cymbomonas tetramitiformis]